MIIFVLSSTEYPYFALTFEWHSNADDTSYGWIQLFTKILKQVDSLENKCFIKFSRIFRKSNFSSALNLCWNNVYIQKGQNVLRVFDRITFVSMCCERGIVCVLTRHVSDALVWSVMAENFLEYKEMFVCYC